MSNLVQFLGQYNTTTELIDGSIIDISLSKINKFIATGTINSVGMNVNSNVAIGTYLNVESFAYVPFSTANPPTQTTGVQVNFPSNISQYLNDNSIPQGLWTPYAIGNTVANSNYVTYGRATDILGGTLSTVFKASLILSSSATLICMGSSASSTHLDLYIYNPITKVLGPIKRTLTSTLWTAALSIEYPQYVVNLFSTGSNSFAVGLSAVGPGSGSSVTSPMLAIFGCTYSGQTITTGTPVNSSSIMSSSGSGITQNLTTSWTQISVATFAGVYFTGSNSLQIFGVSIVGTVATIATFANSLNYSGTTGVAEIYDAFSVYSGLAVVVRGSNPTLKVVTFTLSGTTTPVFVNDNTINSSMNVVQIGFVHKLAGDNYMSMAFGYWSNGSYNANRYFFQGFSISSSLVITTVGPLSNFDLGTNETNVYPPSYDITYARRTEVYKVRPGTQGTGPQCIVGSNTYLIPRSYSDITLNKTRPGKSVLAFTISGTTVTSGNGTGLTVIPGTNPNNTSSTTDGTLLWPVYSASTPTYYLFSNSGSSCQFGRKLNLNGYNTTIGSTDFLNNNSPTYSNYDSQDSFIIDETKAFGRFKVPNGTFKYYALNKANKYNNSVTSVETALTLDGSILIATNQSADGRPGYNTDIWLIDGAF